MGATLTGKKEEALMSYQQITHEERYQIEILLKAGKNYSQIGRLLDRDASSISREVRRNSGLRGYRVRQAHSIAMRRRLLKAETRIADSTWVLVERLIREDWSPEQISVWMATENGLSISHEWIYHYIYRDKAWYGDLYHHLRCKKKRRRRSGSYDKRGQIPGRKSIDERPDVVNERVRIGDWEGDTMIGKGHKHAIVTLTERKSRYTLLRKVEAKSADAVKEAILSMLAPLAKNVLTITSDNGKEFTRHEEIARELNAQFYFAHPYSSWERGTNENTNGLVRQYIPKDLYLCNVTDDDVHFAQDRLNNRPRKCLGFKTPNQVMFGIKPTFALAS